MPQEKPPDAYAGVAPDPYGPRAETPRPLRDLWLRFHEAELCLDLDALFLFQPDGLEIWCLVEDEKSYQKFAAMVEPLKAAYRIDLYTTRLPAPRKPLEEKEPPPSLWANSELLNYINDPYARAISATIVNPGQSLDEAMQSSRNSIVKQRLILFADQVSEWNRKLKRYGLDLPALAREGFGPQAPEDFRGRAESVCLAHAQGLDKYSQRLTEHLSQALPRPAKRADAQEKGPKSNARVLPIEVAQQLRSASTAAARGVYRFLHPQQHTVEVTDLREPSLLESLRSLHALISDLHGAALRRR